MDMPPPCALTVRIPPSLQQQLLANGTSSSSSEITRAFRFLSSCPVRDKPRQTQRWQSGSSTGVQGGECSAVDPKIIKLERVEKVESPPVSPRTRSVGQPPLKIHCGDADGPNGLHMACCPPVVDTFSSPLYATGKQKTGTLTRPNAGGDHGKDSFRGKVGNQASSIGSSATVFPAPVIPPPCSLRLPPHPLLHAPTSPSSIATLAIPGIILSCAHHTHLHRSLFPPSLSKALSPSSFGLLPTTILSTQIPQQSYIDLVTPTIQLEIPMLMYHLDRTGDDCAWSENPTTRSLLAPGYTAGLRALRRRKWGAVCEDTVIGDCVLLRWDRKPLTVEHVEGIVEFLRYVSGEDGVQDSDGVAYFTKWSRGQEEQARLRWRGVVKRGERKRSLGIDVGEAGTTVNLGAEREDGKLTEGYMTPSDAGYESGGIVEGANSEETGGDHSEDNICLNRRVTSTKGTLEPSFPRKVITRENFEAFWRRYCEEKIQAGVSSWISAKIPYEI